MTTRRDWTYQTGDAATPRWNKTESQEVAMKKLWIVPLTVGAAAMSWLVVANAPDIKRYMRMHQM